MTIREAEALMKWAHTLGRLTDIAIARTHWQPPSTSLQPLDAPLLGILEAQVLEHLQQMPVRP